VYEGLPAGVRPACRVANGAADFAGAIRDLLRRSKEDLRTIASRASFDELAWETCLAPVGGILARVAG
jgi:hypothetical protein